MGCGVMASFLIVTQEMLVRIQPPQHTFNGDNMKTYDFHFTLRSYGLDCDQAFNALAQCLNKNPSVMFTNVVDYEEVTDEESREELTTMLEHAIEEMVCSQEEGEA